MLKWETADGFSFPNGTIFDRLNGSNIAWRLYAGDDLPIVGAFKGINILTDINNYDDFAQDVAQPNYPASYTFIEPDYGDTSNGTFECGTSQHPLDDVTRGEALIKATYEAIRNSPIWSTSLIVITWDEHGGFFDHVAPPPAVPPGDTAPGSTYNLYAFSFNQFGPRVPSLIISPLIPRNLIDHRVYDHSSIPATLEACFGLNAMTRRDAGANSLMPLVSLVNPRDDAPIVLAPLAQSGLTNCDPVSFDRSLTEGMASVERLPVTRSQGSFNEENLPGFVFVAARSDLAVSAPEQKNAIVARLNAIKTRADASQYMNEVRVKVRAARNAAKSAALSGSRRR
jgi:phospholipase C